MFGARTCLPIAFFLTIAAQCATLRITVLEGEGALNDVKSRRAKEPVVRVEDAAGRPVAGAAVNFILPAQGAGGSFAGEASLTMTTGGDGRAVGRGLRPNRIAGPYIIRVTASHGGESATGAIHQTNVAPTAAGTSARKIGILALIGGAAAGGILAATHGGSKSAGTATTGGTTGTIGTTVSPGAPTFGPPH